MPNYYYTSYNNITYYMGLGKMGELCIRLDVIITNSDTENKN